MVDLQAVLLTAVVVKEIGRGRNAKTHGDWLHMCLSESMVITVNSLVNQEIPH